MRKYVSLSSGRWRAGAERLALHVLRRRAAGADHAVDLAQRSGFGALGAIARAPPRGTCDAAERRELAGEHAALTRFTMVDLFADRSVRGRLIAASVLMLSVTFGFWGVATFVPTYVARVAAAQGLAAPHYAAVAGLLYTGMQTVGFIALGFLADAIGRKPTTMLWYAMSLILTPVVYLWTHQMWGIAAGRDRLRVLQRRHLVLGADLAARAVPDAHARDGGRLLLQCAALAFRVRPVDRRDTDRRPWRLRSGRDHRRPVLHRWRRGGTVPAGDQRPALAGHAAIVGGLVAGHTGTIGVDAFACFGTGGLAWYHSRLVDRMTWSGNSMKPHVSLRS